MKKRGESGFTLMEVLVALAVFGLLMGGLTQGMRFGFAAWQSQGRALEARADVDTVDRTLRALIANASPGSLSGEPPRFVGTSRALTFTTLLPGEPDGGATREADVTLTVDKARQLLLLWRPLYRNPVGPPPPPRQTLLLTGVDHLELAYWQNVTGPSARWQAGWNDEALPKLVRIRIVTTRAGDRRIPDIIGAPMRDRWRQ